MSSCSIFHTRQPMYSIWQHDMLDTRKLQTEVAWTSGTPSKICVIILHVSTD